MSIQRMIEPLAEALRDNATVRTVFGEPIEANGKTVIPVARVAFGMGRGFGKVKSFDLIGRPREQPVESGGGGASVSPLGVLEVSEKRTRFVPLKRRGVAAWAILFLVGLALGALVTRQMLSTSWGSHAGGVSSYSSARLS